MEEKPLEKKPLEENFKELRPSTLRSGKRGFLFWILGALGVALFGWVFYVLWYVGYFQKVEVLPQTKVSPAILIYKEHLGPYHEMPQILEELEGWAASHGMPCQKTFGEYFDDPDETEPNRLRSRGGCFLQGNEAQLFVTRFEERRTQDKELPPLFLSEHWKGGTFLVMKFKGAPSIGPIKVYPLAHAFAKDNRLILKEGAMEIYDQGESKLLKSGERSLETTYLFNLEERQKAEANRGP